MVPTLFERRGHGAIRAKGVGFPVDGLCRICHERAAIRRIRVVVLTANRQPATDLDHGVAVGVVPLATYLEEALLPDDGRGLVGVAPLVAQLEPARLGAAVGAGVEVVEHGVDAAPAGEIRAVLLAVPAAVGPDPLVGALPIVAEIEVEVDVAGDAVDPALELALPHGVAALVAAVVGLDVCDPPRPRIEHGRHHLAVEPAQERVHAGLVARALDVLGERGADVRELQNRERGLVVRILDVVVDGQGGLGAGPCVEQRRDEGSFGVGLADVARRGVEVQAERDAQALALLDIVAPLVVLDLPVRRDAGKADPDDREIDAVCLNLLPVDRVVPGADVDALADGAGDRRFAVESHPAG